jgi:hypothetical protein
MGVAGSDGARWRWALVPALVALVIGVLRSIEVEAVAGTQQCNTECQSKMTDCILACDGMRSCEETCKKKGQSCVAICSSDAGPELAPVLDGAVDVALDQELTDARSVTAKDASARAAARDR